MLILCATLKNVIYEKCLFVLYMVIEIIRTSSGRANKLVPPWYRVSHIIGNLYYPEVISCYTKPIVEKIWSILYFDCEYTSADLNGERCGLFLVISFCNLVLNFSSKDLLP